MSRREAAEQQLIEMCRMVDTVLIDKEIIYAPRHGNDRLLLGLNGQSQRVRARSIAAGFRSRPGTRRRAAANSLSALRFVKAGDRYEKNQDWRVQEVVCLVFDKVLGLGSARQGSALAPRTSSICQRRAPRLCYMASFPRIRCRKPGTTSSLRRLASKNTDTSRKWY